MKNKAAKTVITVILSLALLILPLYVIYINFEGYSISSKLVNNVNYPISEGVVVFGFTARDKAECALKALRDKNQINAYSVITAYHPIVEAYVTSQKPEIEYNKNGEIDGKEKFYASVNNGRMLDAFSSYQLSEEFADRGLIKLKNGRMMNFNEKNADCIEIVVTEGLGICIGETVYLTVNGLDEQYRQPVIKAEVVGIAEKGTFLFGSADYCGRDIGTEKMYSYIFNQEMIYVPDLSYLYKYEKSPNEKTDKEIPVFAICAMGNAFTEDTVNAVVFENMGEFVVKNSICVYMNSDFEANRFRMLLNIYGIAIPVIGFIFADAVLIKNIRKKD